MPSKPFLFFTDAPPLREGGVGGHLLAYNLIRDFGEMVRMVMTRPGWIKARRKDIFHTPGAKTVIFPDFGSFRLGFLRPWVELFLFIAFLPFLAWSARRSDCQRLFALIGGDSWFLPKIELLRRATGLPLEIYLIDDLEASCELAGDPLRAKATRWVENYVLQRATRIFAISPGYVEHLAVKYHVSATWLPLAVERVSGHTPFRPRQPDVRALTFLGSINPLYLDSLCALYHEITRWNHSSNPPYELRLRILTRREPPELITRLPNRNFLELVLNLDTQAMYTGLQEAWALFLPYSFDPTMKLMVSTSFSHKFTESIAVGRPILVYGPAYASIPRYFREQGLPLCAQSPAELMSILGEIESHDNAELVDRYRALAERYHSPRALRNIVS